jgi:hypothetical protein
MISMHYGAGGTIPKKKGKPERKGEVIFRVSLMHKYGSNTSMVGFVIENGTEWGLTGMCERTTLISKGPTNDELGAQHVQASFVPCMFRAPNK